MFGLMRILPLTHDELTDNLLASLTMTVRVKICGITNLEDALAAIEAGADALGFVFCETSPRKIAPAQAAQIIAALPPFVSKVGVFADASEQAVRQIADQCDLDLLQLHGQETPEFCNLFGVKAVKAFRIKDESSLEGLRAYRTAAWLLDSFVPGQLGGSGQVFNWELARRATELGRPVILAGGLAPLNVGQAVRQVRPYAVDVS